MYLLKRFAALTATLAVCVTAVVSVKAEQVVQVSSSAACAVLYEPSSGRVLFEQQAHVKRPMASTTKLMTALLAVEQLPQDAVLTASAQALAVEGSSMGLCVDDTITRDDLLRGLLLSSGNDAANVFALSMADSFEAFADNMNAKAAELGMTNSCFVTPSGLDAEGHGASAYDMALLAAAVLENELLAAICASEQATIHVGDRTVTLRNHNRLLSMYDGAIGMKTGYTSKAGRCLVSAARRDGVTLIAVTLNCANDWEEHTTLLDAGFALLTTVSFPPKTWNGRDVFGGVYNTVEFYADSAEVTVMQADQEAIEETVQMPAYLWAPVKAGDIVGEVRYVLRGACLASVPIRVKDDIAQVPVLSQWQRWRLRFEQLLQRALT